MKKNVLALSVATMIGGLGFSGAAMAQAAFAVNQAGDNGHIQIVPYFTAQDGNATALHVVNTDTENGKAVKVRFRGASNSDDILDFQVFLSPGDVWTGQVKAGADGLMRLSTKDNSCTLPASVAASGGANAVTSRLNFSGWDAAAKREQTREGYVEILNMADIPPTVPADASGNTVNPLFTAIKHVNGVAPCTPAAFTALDGINDGGKATPRLNTPTASLVASWYIINIANSTTFSGPATALVAFNDETGIVVGELDEGNPVYSQQRNGAPSLATADPLMVADADDRYQMVTPQRYDVPDLSTPLIGDNADPEAAATQAGDLTAALRRNAVSNQFFADDDVSAATDWVFSMPTRRYTVAANYNADVNNAAYIQINAGVAKDTSLFTNRNNLFVKNGQICVTTGDFITRDREENQEQQGHVISPSTQDSLDVCGETSVLTFGSYSPLGAELSRSTMGTPYKEGWGTVSFAGNGAPVLGHAFTAASNPAAAAGMVGNYGITWPHFTMVTGIN